MLEFQRLLLGDRIRNEAFYKALKIVIKKGQTVVADIGSGTGFLSFLAAKLGARECYLYEQLHELAKLGTQIASDNKIRNCKFIPAHSVQVKRPPRVDVVISETLGNFALEEHIIENLNDARRFLRPGGIVIPSLLEQFVAPIISPRLMREINIWNNVGFGLNLKQAREASLNNMYVKKILPSDLPGKEQIKKWDLIDFDEFNESVREAQIEWEFPKSTTIYGFALWWKCTLINNISLSTSPFDKPTHWDQVFLPITSEVKIQPHDTLKLDIQSDSRFNVGINVKWVTSLVRKGKVIQKVLMNMEKGL